MKTHLHKTEYPVGLLLAGRPCLVAGGGAVALRKVEGLLEAGARVTVAAAAPSPPLRAHIAAGRVRHLPHDFEAADAAGCVLVFAATGNKVANRHILAACREGGVLCCSADGNWHRGDFVTPAVWRGQGMTVAVTSGGRNCRRSRRLRATLAGHITRSTAVECFVIGVSHERVGLAEREAFHLDGDRLDAAGAMLACVADLHEFMLLSTCNRTELIGVRARGTRIDPLLKRILGVDKLAARRVTVRRGYWAFEHLTLLIAGLLSQSPGESHITAQVKAALATAAERDWSGGMLDEWVATSLHVAKHIRRRPAAPVTGGDEIEDDAMRLIARERPDGDVPVTVLGAGVLGRGMVRRLAARGFPCAWVYHRRRPTAPVPSGVRLVPWRERAVAWREASVVIAATAARKPVLGPADAGGFDPERSVLLLDLSSPRNIDPALAARLPHARLVDLDDLKRERASAGSKTWREAGRAEVRAHRDHFKAMMRRFRGELEPVRRDAKSGVME